MSRKRVETVVRLLAETELRHVTRHPRDRAPPPDVPGAEREAVAFLRRSAGAAITS